MSRRHVSCAKPARNSWLWSRGNCGRFGDCSARSLAHWVCFSLQSTHGLAQAALFAPSQARMPKFPPSTHWGVNAATSKQPARQTLVHVAAARNSTDGRPPPAQQGPFYGLVLQKGPILRLIQCREEEASAPLARAKRHLEPCCAGSGQQSEPADLLGGHSRAGQTVRAMVRNSQAALGRSLTDHVLGQSLTPNIRRH